MTVDGWSKPKSTILVMVLRAVLDGKFHVRCLLRVAWVSKRELYVFEELGGFRPWLWHAWQWMVDYIEHDTKNHLCDACIWVGKD